MENAQTEVQEELSLLKKSIQENDNEVATTHEAIKKDVTEIKSQLKTLFDQL